MNRKEAALTARKNLRVFFHGLPGGPTDRAVEHAIESVAGKVTGKGTLLVGPDAPLRDVEVNVPTSRLGELKDKLNAMGITQMEDQ